MLPESNQTRSSPQSTKVCNIILCRLTSHDKFKSPFSYDCYEVESVTQFDSDFKGSVSSFYFDIPAEDLVSYN